MPDSVESADDTQRSVGHPLPDSASAPRVMTVCLIAQIASVMPVFLLGAFAPLMTDDLGLTPFMLGIAVAAFYGAAAVGALFLAPFADTAGVWRVTNLSLAVVALCGILMALIADSFEMVVALIVLGGLMNGSIQPATNVIVSRFIPTKRQGLAYGLKQAAIPLSTMLGGIAVPVIGLSVGWRWAFMLSVVTALAVLLMTPKGREPRTKTGNVGRQRLPGRILLILALMMGLAAAVSNAMAAFLALAITEQEHSASDAGLVIAAGSLFCVAMRVGLGGLVDRWNLPLMWVVAALLMVGTGSYLGLAYWQTLPLLTFSAFLAFGFGWGWSGLVLLAIGRASIGSVGASTGMTHAGVFTGGVVGPMAFGWVVQEHGFLLAWQGLAVASTCAAGLAIWMSTLLNRVSESR